MAERNSLIDLPSILEFLNFLCIIAFLWIILRSSRWILNKTLFDRCTFNRFGKGKIVKRFDLNVKKLDSFKNFKVKYYINQYLSFTCSQTYL